jgi:hypothetical protein
LEEISVDTLAEPSSFVSFQLLFLVPASVEDDPDLNHNWCWSGKHGNTFHAPVNDNRIVWIYLHSATTPWTFDSDMGLNYVILMTIPDFIGHHQSFTDALGILSSNHLAYSHRSH